MNKVSSRICSVFSGNSRYRCRFWLNSAEKEFITGGTVSSHNCQEGWRKRSQNRYRGQTHTGHLDQKPAQTRLLRTPGSPHRPLPGSKSPGQPRTLPLTSLLLQSLEPRLCAASTPPPASKFLLVSACDCKVKILIGQAGCKRCWESEILATSASLELTLPVPVKARTAGSLKFRMGTQMLSNWKMERLQCLPGVSETKDKTPKWLWKDLKDLKGGQVLEF